MFHDGSLALEGKDYLLQHPEVAQVTVEGQTYFPPPKKVTLARTSNVQVSKGLNKPCSNFRNKII